MNELHARRGAASSVIAPGIDVLDAAPLDFGSAGSRRKAKRKARERYSFLACISAGLACALFICLIATLMRTANFMARTRRVSEMESGKDGTCARLRSEPVGLTPDIRNMTVSELSKMSEYEVAERFIKGNQPFVMRGVLPKDTALATDESLVRAFDARESMDLLTVEDWTGHTKNGIIDDEDGRFGKPIYMNASSFVDQCYLNPWYTITNYTIGETPPAGIENIDLPAFIVKIVRQSWDPVITTLWWSASGANTHWHMDDWSHNFIFNFDGYKTVHIIDSGDIENMYLPKSERPGDPDDETDGRSPVDKKGMGFDDPRFPLAKRVRPMYANLAPGDILYFPAWWLHKVVTPHQHRGHSSKMVNMFFQPEPQMSSDPRCCSPYHKWICRVYRMVTVLPHRARNLALDLIYYSPAHGIDFSNGKCIACSGEAHCRNTLGRDWHFRHEHEMDRHKMGFPLPTDRFTVYDLRWFESITDMGEQKLYNGCHTSEWRLDFITTMLMLLGWTAGVSVVMSRSTLTRSWPVCGVLMRALDRIMARETSELAKATAMNAALTAIGLLAVYRVVFHDPEIYSEDW